MVELKVGKIGNAPRVALSKAVIAHPCKGKGEGEGEEILLLEGPKQCPPPPCVTMRGEEAALLVPVEQWRRLNARARPGLKALLLEHQALPEFAIPLRGKLRGTRRVDVPV